MSNSNLVAYTKLSPNVYGKRKYPITRISPHCVVGQCSIESLGAVFANPSRRASSNYGIGKDGRIGLFVDESVASGCTSSPDNDHRAITIECASDTYAPYAFNNVVYNRLIDLCVDICKRNGKTKLLWFGDKRKTLSYVPKSNEMVITVHRWYANKSCCGDWLYVRLGDLAKKVNARLTASSVTLPAPSKEETKKIIKATGVAKKFDRNLSRSYVTTDNLNVRDDAGVKYKVLGTLPRGTTVRCYGYYSLSGIYKWLYIVATVKGVQYTGFVSKAYLK